MPSNGTVVLVGMGVVFVSLIVLVFLLQLSAIVFARKAVAVAPPAVAPTAPANGVPPEHVAVIAAAVAAASGQPLTAIRIVNVARAETYTPVRGRAGRASSVDRAGSNG